MSVGTNALRRHEAAQRSHDTVLHVSEALNEQWQLDSLRDNIGSLLSNKAEFNAALQMYERCVVEGYMATMSYNDIGVAPSRTAISRTRSKCSRGASRSR